MATTFPPGTMPPAVPGEEWRPVKGHEERYLVSSLGRVWSLGYVKSDAAWRSANAQMVALLPHEHGYMTVRVNHRAKRVHRLVAEAFLGLLPGEDVDHINRNRRDNRIDNLRRATRQQNGWNAGRTRRNRTGVRGVNWDATREKFRVEIRAGAVRRQIGRFDTLEEAAAARRAAAARLHGEFAGD